ncbi:MAG: hypothetical protein HOH18_01945 [Kordiimonadaceae bacterium]|jgi:hypothetical protein|nr:hypothetical protein [Kordiimonadaceae bacterium]MBT6035214.1 hypothetical protein [Kordiimonadaceae bacterium]
MTEINVHAPSGVNSHAPAHAGHGKKSSTEDTSSSDPSSAVDVTLSDEAQDFLGDIPGKSVAHRARAALAQEGFEALSGLSFGKIVSTLARGLELSTLLPEPVVEEKEEGTEETPTDEVPPSLSDEEPTETILGDAEIALSLLTPLDEEAA